MANFLINDFKQIIKGNNPLYKIILINVIIFVFTNLLGSWLPVEKWFALPGELTQFVLQFWSIVTYMFLHADFMHLLFNMLWLHWMGRILIEYLGPRRFVAIYFLGGIVGGLAYLLIFNLLAINNSYPMGNLLLGASAGVMAIIAGTGTLLPNFRVNLFLIGSVPLKYVAIGALVLTSLLDFSVNMGGKLAHIGGAILGYFFIKNLQKGIDFSTPFYSILFTIINPFVKKKMRVVSKPKKDTQNTPSQQPSYSNENDNFDQEKVDHILDKIGKSGYDSLTKKEKEFLFKTSKRN